MEIKNHFKMDLKNTHAGLKLTGFFVLVLLFFSCKHGNNDPGYSYMPDMAYSHAGETNTENSVFANGMNNQLPVEGTIPREMIPYQYEKTYDAQLKAGEELINPFEPVKSNLEIGKKQYTIYCASCHGFEGKGDGHLYTSKLFTAKPTALNENYVQSKPDGEIYHIITMGSLSGLMGPHGSQIKPENRWKIILYLRSGF